ncbi:fibronectin type III-like domain-contianing protein [Alistipes putredinis]|uniref:fibronectin type III-like domain-contianing protein n=1 Tax=Alistipes putredinis TaxID=28117 RepID=UPI003992420F
MRLTNSGRRDGVEVVQLYIRDRVGSSTRPVQGVKELSSVALESGASRDVGFTIRRLAAQIIRFRPAGAWPSRASST